MAPASTSHPKKRCWMQDRGAWHRSMRCTCGLPRFSLTDRHAHKVSPLSCKSWPDSHGRCEYKVNSMGGACLRVIHGMQACFVMIEPWGERRCDKTGVETGGTSIRVMHQDSCFVTNASLLVEKRGSSKRKQDGPGGPTWQAERVSKAQAGDDFGTSQTSNNWGGGGSRFLWQ